MGDGNGLDMSHGTLCATIRKSDGHIHKELCKLMCIPKHEIAGATFVIWRGEVSYGLFSVGSILAPWMDEKALSGWVSKG